MVAFVTAVAGVAVVAAMAVSGYMAAHAPRRLVRVRSR